MVQGIYVVKFTPLGRDYAGLAVIDQQGNVNGGDSYATFSGRLETNDQTVSGKIRIQKHDVAIGRPLVPGATDYEVSVVGNVHGKLINAQFTLLGDAKNKVPAQLTSFPATLHKVRDLT